MANAESIKVNTASQRISRSQDILQMKGFLKSSQSICYLPEHKNNGELLDAVSKIFSEQGRKYWYTLNALKMHDGAVSQKYLECYTNYPIVALQGHLPFNKIMQRFVSEEILVFTGVDYKYSPKFSSQISNELLHRTIETIKDKIVDDFHLLCRNTGLISYNTGEVFGEYGKFRWAFKGASYIAGIRANDKPGFILADILIGKPFYRTDVLFFLEKLKHVQAYKNAPRLIPFLLVDDLDAEALKSLKAYGVVVGFIGELFGQKYASTLRELVAILNNAGASLKAEPDKYLDLIAELKKYNEGLVNNIRGTLFEFVVAHIHREQCQSIDLGREIIANNARHDLDVFALYSDKVVIAECKSVKSMVDEDMVEHWLNKKIPAFRGWIKKQETLVKKGIEFEYWSTSGFTDGAIQLLSDAASSATKYGVRYFTGSDIKAKAVKMKNKKLKEALDNFFLKPLV